MRRAPNLVVAVAAMMLASGAAMAVEIDPADEQSLVFMREEEKLARDVYLALGDRWDLAVFTNIASAEQQHMDAVLRLLDEYEIDDPVLGPGSFANEELQVLYDDLVAQGAESLEEALRVGALIEEVDIEDLTEALEASEAEDVQRVYGRLLDGSYNHLWAFVSQLERMGVEYDPVVLDDEAFERIASDAPGRGRQRPPRRGRI